MLQSGRVTAFTVSELLRENQQRAWGKGGWSKITRLRLIKISFFLTVCKLLKHISSATYLPKVYFVCTHDNTIDFGMILLIYNSSLNFEINLLHSFPMESCILNTRDTKLLCSISSILRSYSRFFSC